MTRQRLDEALVERGLYPSRSRARDAILRGTVKVNDTTAQKPAQSISTGDRIALADLAQPYVSRAALKLKFALEHFSISPLGRHCLDIGASTGGFSQILLEAGAHHITALDVGHGQLHPNLAQNPHLTSLEGFNIRDLKAGDVPGNITLIVCDVSFISLRVALPSVLALADPGTILIALIKPQFEAGRQALSRGGLIRDPAVHASIVSDIVDFLNAAGWQVQGHAPSPLQGGDGNQEFVIAAVKEEAS